MSRRVHLTALARLDLIEIAVFIAEGNPAAADRFIRALTETIDRLGQRPMLGRARPELGRNVRTLPHQRYVIVYRPTPPPGATILRVLHGSRDIPPLFDQDL